MPEEMVNIELYKNAESNKTGTLVFRHSVTDTMSGRMAGSGHGLIRSLNYFNLRSEFTLPMQNQPWHIVFTPTPAFLRKQSAWRHFAVLTAGLIITVFIVLYSWKSRRHKLELQSLADYLSVSNEELQHEIKAKEQVTTILTDVAETIIAKTGESLYQILVVQLCQTLKVDYAFIGLYTDEAKTHIRTNAFYAGGSLRENFEYPVFNTPCARIVKGEICIVAEKLQEQYPDSAIVKEANAESYAGISIQDSDNNPIGVLAIMSFSPLEDTDAIRAVLKIFSTRIAAEVEHERKIRKIRDLAKLHDENPNPVLRADYNGRLLYANMIAVSMSK